MVQWLAHLTCNPGNMGSIPTHGICFHSKWISQYFVLARDYIVGFPVLHSKYIYIYLIVIINARLKPKLWQIARLKPKRETASFFIYK